MTQVPPPPPPPGAPAPKVEPPALGTIRTMLKIAKILAIIFGILLILYGIGTAALIAMNPFAQFFGPGIYTGPVIAIIFGIVDIIIWKQIEAIQSLVDQGRYQEAKSKNLIWAILGLVLGGILIGIFLIIAYLKYDEVIRATQGVAY